MLIGFFVCEENEEGIDHLLIHFPNVWLVWTSLLEVACVVLVIPRSVTDYIYCWSQIPLSKDDSKVWRITLCCLFWQFGRRKKRVVFEEKEVAITR